jgi:hypothetical protein
MVVIYGAYLRCGDIWSHINGTIGPINGGNLAGGYLRCGDILLEW